MSATVSETAVLNRGGDLLSTRRMLSGGKPGEASAGDRHSTSAHFAQPGSIQAALEHAHSLGLQQVVSIGEARLFDALQSAGDRAPQMLPIVPNIQGFMREAVEHGIVGAGVQRVRRMGLAPLMGLGVRGVARLPRLAKRDFPTLLLCFIELELADFRSFDPPTVFLQAQVTDLALAMENPRILAAFVDAVRRLSGGAPGFMTHNLGTLAEKCDRWGIPLGAAITPWEESGAGMRPDRVTCEKALAATGAALWADRSGHVEEPGEAERKYLKRTGAAGILRDDDAVLGLAHAEPVAMAG
jgi:hypothetical protein